MVDGWTCTDVETEQSQCNAVCGDGKMQMAVEQCDDDNTDNGDGCSDTCTVEPGYECLPQDEDAKTECQLICGNGVLDDDELCEDGN